MNDIVKLTAQDGTTYYVEKSCYRFHHPVSENTALTRVGLAFSEKQIFVQHVVESCEQVHRLFDSEYDERMTAIESAESLVKDAPSLVKDAPSPKFCKLKPDALWLYKQNLIHHKGQMGGVLEIMAFNRGDGRYHVKIVAFPDEGFYVYPKEVDYCHPNGNLYPSSTI